MISYWPSYSTSSPISMDQFAQSREDDNLFGDEFEPVSAPTFVEEPAPVNNSYVPPITESSKDGGRSTGTQDYRREQGRGRGAQRGRGRGGSRGGLAGSRYAPQATPAQNKAESIPTAPAADDTTSASPHNATNDANGPKSSMESTSTDQTPPPSTTQPQPSSETPIPDQPQPQSQERPRAIAVRGDRSLTGGPTHVKLTESELSEKMARMAILNAQKAERFRLSEADSAAFLQKEAEMKKKRVEEMKNSRAMDQERARNRERKLKAQGGREWDSEKQESDIVDGRGRGRSSEYVRGGHGGVIKSVGLGGSRFADEETPGEGYQGRGRGNFEIRGRGNRGGRGGRGGKSTPSFPTSEDFPSLPSAPAKSPAPAKVDESVKSPGIEKGAHDWAEEMATPVEEKKMDV